MQMLINAQTWILLFAAIFLEVVGTTFLKISEGFTKPYPTAIMLAAYIGGFYLLSIVIKTMEVGMVYAIWSGVGTALIAIIGVLWFKDVMTLQKAVSIVIIIIGVIGLNLGQSNLH